MKAIQLTGFTGKLCALERLVPKLALMFAAGCSQNWEKAVPATDGAPAADAANVGVERAALSTTQGVYVVALDASSNAYCDGVSYATDHGAALQACINNANADGGGTVLVRAGTYSTGTWPLTAASNVTILGDGHLGAILKPTAAQIIGNVGNNVSILGLTFDGTNVSEGTLRFDAGFGAGGSNVRIENNQFLLTNTTASSFSGIYSYLTSTAFSRVAIRANSFVISGGAFENEAPISLRSSAATINYVRIENNDMLFTTTPHTPISYAIYVEDGTGTYSSQGLVINGNTVRSSTALSGVDVFLAGIHSFSLNGNLFQTGSLVASAGTSNPCAGVLMGNVLARAPSISSCSVQSAGNSLISSSLAGGVPTVALHAYRSGSQTFTAGSGTTVKFNNVDVDSGGNYSTSTGVFTAPVGGLYRVNACLRVLTTNFTAGTDSSITNIYTTAAPYSVHYVTAGGAGTFSNCISDLVSVATGDPIQIVTDATGSATTRTISGTGRYSTYLSIERVAD
jgi:hypothetical protein